MDVVQLSGIETNGMNGIQGRTSSDVGEGGYVASNGNAYCELPNAEGVGVYQDIDDAVAEMYECMDAQAAADPLGKVDKGEGCVDKCNVLSRASDADAVIDVYEQAGCDGGAAVGLPCKNDRATYTGTYI